MKEKQGRGILTPRIRAASLELLGYEITQTELRLMPYLQYVVTNKQEIDYRRVNFDDIDILAEWEKKRYIRRGQDEKDKVWVRELDEKEKVWISEIFWNAISRLIYLGYVDL